MSQGGVYSEQKMSWWYAREGKLPDAPKQVHWVLSDLCNQDCSFCLTSDAIIATLDGDKSIADVRIGDWVFGPSGRPCRVEITSERTVAAVYEITAGSKTIRASEEHPILTQAGWKAIRQLADGDSAVVRVRMRDDDQLERAIQEVGQVRLSSQKETDIAICGEDDRTQIGRGLPGSAAMQMWMQSSGAKAISGPVERFYSATPDSRPQNDRGWERSESAENDHEQSDEESRNSGESCCAETRYASGSHGTGQEKHCRCGQEAHVVRQESDARSGQAQGRHGEDSVAANQQERIAFQDMGGGARSTAQAHGRWNILDRETKPGFSSGRATQTDRSDSAHVLHRLSKDPDAARLRRGYNRALSEQGMELSGGVQGRSSLADTEGVDRNDQELCIAGIKLEWGLALRPIDSVRRITGTFTVYNFSCSPEEAYEANGIIVHNCSYRVSGNPSNELFASGSKLSSYGHDNPVRFVDTDRALRLVDEMKSLGVLGVQATGGGEPSAHPEHERIFRKILDSGIKLALVSNGYRWRDQLFTLIPRMDWLRVSVDAGCAKTYASIRRTPESAFDKVLGNISRAARTIVDAGSQTTLGVGFTVTPDNWCEIFQGAVIAKEAGAHNIRLSAMFGPDNEKPFLPVYDQIKALIVKARAEIEDDTFTIYDNFGSRLSDLVQHSPEFSFCPYQFYTTYIGGNLQSFRCCVLSYSRQGMIAGGDLTNRRFDDFWHSQQRIDDLNSLDPRRCPKCMFNGKIREALYIMGNTESDTTPRHMEFP